MSETPTAEGRREPDAARPELGDLAHVGESKIPAPPLGRLRNARDAVICIAICVLLLLAFEGASIRRAGDDMDHGWQRTMVLAIGQPLGALSDASGLGAVKDRVLAWERRRHRVDSAGLAAASGRAGAGTVTPDSIDPRAIGARPAAPPRLRTLLVTGDSMTQPLDALLARAFVKASTGVHVIRDPHLGTGISKPDVLDWGAQALQQVADHHPQAVVMFLGANEGWPLKVGKQALKCCGPAWTAAYASRVQQVMNIYRQAGAARVYWLTLPGARERARWNIERAVNVAIGAASAPYRAQVRVVDLVPTFAPGGRYRDAMPVGGVDQVVRQHDGLHLNEKGAEVAKGIVLNAVRSDFGPAVVPGGNTP